MIRAANLLRASLPAAWPRLRLRRCLTALVTIAVIAYALYVFAGPNAHAVIEGRVFRSAQLSGGGMTRQLERHGIRTVINLRGHCPTMEWYAEEAAAIAVAGASQEDVTLSANRLPAPGELRRLIEILDQCEYPVLFHCKQGADRTGLASAVVLLLHTDATLARARKELWPHRGHFPVARTIAMDEFFDRYEAWLSGCGATHTPERFREWAARHYSPGPAAAELSWVRGIPAAIPADRPFSIVMRARNISGDDWNFRAGSTAGIHVQYQLHNQAGEQVHLDRAGLMRRTVAPGESIELHLPLPPLPPGRYQLRADLADFRGAGLPVRAQYFFQFGSEALLAVLHVE